MTLSTKERTEILIRLGAGTQDMEQLLDYTASAFAFQPSQGSSDFLLRWKPVIETANNVGVANAINRHLVRNDFHINFDMPEVVQLEVYDSFAGKIPIISTCNDSDFESLVQNIILKGKSYPHMKLQGAQFAHSKNNCFIILSHKPYSNTPAEVMGLDDATWREKSFIIRKHHEYAHFYTKKYFGSSRNNLHDELIADFCGIWAAFSHFRAEYFIKFLSQGRMKIYVDGLSTSGAEIIKKLAHLAAYKVEEWTVSSSFAQLSEVERVNYLCEKELLLYT